MYVQVIKNDMLAADPASADIISVNLIVESCRLVYIYINLKKIKMFCFTFPSYNESYKC